MQEIKSNNNNENDKYDGISNLFKEPTNVNLESNLDNISEAASDSSWETIDETAERIALLSDHFTAE
jgi:hypothetical protein